MDMLIRSQDKRHLVKLKSITINKRTTYTEVYTTEPKNYWSIESHGKILGIYSTEEKAIRVLSMIEEEYHRPTYVTDLGGEYEVYGRDVFHMPEDAEVDV